MTHNTQPTRTAARDVITDAFDNTSHWELRDRENNVRARFAYRSDAMQRMAHNGGYTMHHIKRLDPVRVKASAEARRAK